MRAACATAAAAVLLALLVTRWDSTANVSTLTDGNGSAPAPLPEGAVSSLFCEGASAETRRCLVTNLCYLPGDGQFVMLYSEKSSLYMGVNSAAELNPLLKLNPVIDHNLFDLSLVPVAPQWVLGRGAVLHRGSYLLFEPFKPDNLMHALHDDLLPAFATLLHLCGGELSRCGGAPRTLLLHTADLPEEVAPLYAALSSAAPVLTGALSDDTPHCFQRVHLGLRRDTLWYQYGFSRPQAPLPTTDAEPEVFAQFADQVLQRLDAAAPDAGEIKYTEWAAEEGRQLSGSTGGEDDPADRDVLPPVAEEPAAEDQPAAGGDSGRYVLLVSRTQSRRLLNEAALAATLSRRLRRPVRRLALEEVGAVAAARLAASASLLVGVHGAALALAVFLPPGAALLELFPFGLQPRRYQPFRRLCQLRGLGYRAWRNRDPAASVPPPEDAPPDLGGLAHLSAAERQRITQLAEVPDTLCCHDPAFLYWVYQDTRVDAASVAETAAALVRRPAAPAETVAPLWYPGPVREVTAGAGDDVRTVEWREPVAAPPRLRYRVWVQQQEDVSEHVTRRLRLTVPAECADCPLLVWIRAEQGDRHGALVHAKFRLS